MILFLGIPFPVFAWYIYRLIVRLRRSPTSRSSRTNAYALGGAEQLDNVSYQEIDMLKTVPPATHAGYAVVGGSGFLGTYIVRLLIMRGETSIRILDVNPPASKLLEHPAVSFIKTDITSLNSVRDALSAPFPTTGVPPTVIFHTAATIRFWERASYCWNASYRVNVTGTRNVLTVAKELPSAMVVYTSSAETVSGCPKFLRVDWDTFPVSIRDDDPTPAEIRKQSCYPRSKRVAEQLVISASVNEGLKTGILRPGHTIIGPNDRLVTSTLMMPRLPMWDQPWCSTEVCVWDVAAAHLVYEDALNRIPEEVSGEAFLITGRGPPWSIKDVRSAIKHYATRELVFDELPPLLMYLLAHVMEAFLFLRYHFLLPFAMIFGSRPSLVPQWLGPAIFLQPATLEGQLIDLIIDDSRARKVLGYHPQWDVAQAIRYSVDEIQSGNAVAEHGLKVQ
ncbi:3Beta-HSD domain-containing protein [Mycena sanguinolenta]|uniref:3Beta-HSD domain-containing protein n=1 Tax=Mycena sanguinolenta TaxID=230812 RepID=A0A8H7DNM6_9AGAR|nr:3Beta-HSD domain-containing protein [Mycena sanguinolenta]